MPYADYGAYPGHESPTEFSSKSGNLSGSPQQIPLSSAAGRIYVQIIGGGGAHITFDGAATASHYLIPPGGVFVYQGRPLISFSLLGVLGGGVYGTYSVHGN
jgi:hypothetical protein